MVLAVICRDRKQFNSFKKDNPNIDLIPIISDNYELIRGVKIQGFITLYLHPAYDYIYRSILLPAMF